MLKDERNLKRKSKDEEIQQVKRQKINLEETIETLKQNLVSEAIASDGATKKNRDHATKAASFCDNFGRKGKDIQGTLWHPREVGGVVCRINVTT